MNKVDLVKNVVNRLAAEDVKVSQRAMGQYVDVIIDVIKDSLISGEEVKIVNFGSFSVVEKPEREARNPQDGSTVVVAAHKAPKFKYSNVVKAAVR